MTITGKEDEEAASTDDLSQYGFSFGPNPSTNFIQLNASASIETVSIKNVIGQTLINKPLGDKNGILDIRTLNTGIYIVEVTINSFKGSFQFVKN
ncbi:MAG: T9SS type A sorting domain-containing protein [Flavicella sp.]